MSVTYQRPDINSFSDVANNPDYNVTTLKGIISETEILVSLRSFHAHFVFYLK